MSKEHPKTRLIMSLFCSKNVGNSLWSTQEVTHFCHNILLFILSKFVNPNFAFYPCLLFSSAGNLWYFGQTGLFKSRKPTGIDRKFSVLLVLLLFFFFASLPIKLLYVLQNSKQGSQILWLLLQWTLIINLLGKFYISYQILSRNFYLYPRLLFLDMSFLRMKLYLCEVLGHGAG